MSLPSYFSLLQPGNSPFFPSFHPLSSFLSCSSLVKFTSSCETFLALPHSNSTFSIPSYVVLLQFDFSNQDTLLPSPISFHFLPSCFLLHQFDSSNQGTSSSFPFLSVLPCFSLTCLTKKNSSSLPLLPSFLPPCSSCRSLTLTRTVFLPPSSFHLLFSLSVLLSLLRFNLTKRVLPSFRLSFLTFPSFPPAFSVSR